MLLSSVPAIWGHDLFFNFGMCLVIMVPSFGAMFCSSSYGLLDWLWLF